MLCFSFILILIRLLFIGFTSRHFSIPIFIMIATPTWWLLPSQLHISLKLGVYRCLSCLGFILTDPVHLLSLMPRMSTLQHGISHVRCTSRPVWYLPYVFLSYIPYIILYYRILFGFWFSEPFSFQLLPHVFHHNFLQWSINSFTPSGGSWSSFSFFFSILFNKV